MTNTPRGPLILPVKPRSREVSRMLEDLTDRVNRAIVASGDTAHHGRQIEPAYLAAVQLIDRAASPTAKVPAYA